MPAAPGMGPWPRVTVIAVANFCVLLYNDVWLGPPQISMGFPEQGIEQAADPELRVPPFFQMYQFVVA